MTVKEGTNLIRESLNNSNLHYFINESPHSIWITIRKRLINCRDPDVKSLNATSTVNVKQEVITEERKVFKEELNRLEAANDTLKLNFESEISQHEQVIKKVNQLTVEVSNKDKVIEDLMLEINTLKSDLNSKEKGSKDDKRVIKETQKVIHDFKRENERLKESLTSASTEVKDLKNQIKADQKETLKKAKAQEKKDHAKSLVTEAKPSDIPCNFCENTGSLRLHIVDAHAKTTNTDDVETKETYTQTLPNNVKEENEKPVEFSATKFELRKFKCDYCGYLFQTQSAMQEHRVGFHNASTYSPNSLWMTRPVGLSTSTAPPSWPPPP